VGTLAFNFARLISAFHGRQVSGWLLPVRGLKKAGNHTAAPTPCQHETSGDARCVPAVASCG
jgi:hypothetical protein